MCKKGTIFNIQRFSTSDGPGIRTVVFLKGCPLDCGWCHNPESKKTPKDIFYKADQCVGCGGCAAVCPKGCHSFRENEHLFQREGCIACGKCAENCYANALEVCGEEKDTAEIMDTVLRDKLFYEQSGGGLTLSGGEPLLQYDFSLELLTLAKEKGLHTAVETCGFTQKDLGAISKVTDLWLFDVKLLDRDAHIQNTGVSNEKILENLRFLDRLGADIVMRCPIIQGVNLHNAHFDALAELANSLENVSQIHIEPYHPLGLSKAQQLNKKQGYQGDGFLEQSEVKPFVEALAEKVKIPVIIL